MGINRREFLAASGALAAASTVSMPSMAQGSKTFPSEFYWGVSTAGHQIEGNNTASDTWFMENIKPTAFAMPSGDACNSFELWQTDLQLIKNMGLNSYRFSIEWARIEPEEGLFSMAMLDYYKRRIAGCKQMGITPFVTFSHFTAPRWFAAKGGWLNPQAPDLFARYCEKATRHLGEDIGMAVTLNEPNLLELLKWAGLPPIVWEKKRKMLDAAAQSLGVEKFTSMNATNLEDLPKALPIKLAAHRAGFDAIKSVRPDLPVGVSIAISDDQAVGENSRIEEKRQEVYSAWLETAKQDDFLGIQNYERSRIDRDGEMHAPEGVVSNSWGGEVYPPSLAGAVKYAHEQTGKPILITEHGVGTEDDSVRQWLIPEALTELKKVMDEGVEVLGYIHWTLMDNFEWFAGFNVQFGLHSFDSETFERIPKASAAVLGDIAKRNAL